MSVLRYPGGKTRAVKILKNYIPKDCKEIISPFFGGGSFEIYCKNNNIKVYANDKFEPLINFWISLKENPNDLIKEIEKYLLLTKDDFLLYRKRLLDKSLDSLIRACYYFIVNRSSFNGSTCSGGFSQQASVKRFNKSSIERLRKINLDNIVFYNMDFCDFLDLYNDDIFIYVDPPYYIKNQLYDLNEEFNHEKLHKTLETKKNWILSYNDCDFIRDLYKDYKITELSWKYGMNKNKISNEILIINTV